MSTLGVSDWLDETMSTSPPLCAKRLSYGDIAKDDDSPGRIHLPRALWQAIAPRNLVSADVPPLPVALCDPFGVRSTGTLGWCQATTLTNTSHELRLCVNEDPAPSLRNPENVGVVAIFVFSLPEDRIECSYYVCESTGDEDDVQERLGPVEPGYAVLQGMKVPRAHGGSGLPVSYPTEIPAAYW